MDLLKITKELFKKTVTMNNQCLFLIGCFSDLQDKGFIFLDENFKKIYIPLNVPFYLNNFLDFNTFCLEECPDENIKFIGVDFNNQAFYISYIKNEEMLFKLNHVKNSKELSEIKIPLLEKFE